MTSFLTQQNWDAISSAFFASSKKVSVVEEEIVASTRSDGKWFIDKAILHVKLDNNESPIRFLCEWKGHGVSVKKYNGDDWCLVDHIHDVKQPFEVDVGLKCNQIAGEDDRICGFEKFIENEPLEEPTKKGNKMKLLTPAETGTNLNPSELVAKVILPYIEHHDHMSLAYLSLFTDNFLYNKKPQKKYRKELSDLLANHYNRVCYLAGSTAYSANSLATPPDYVGFDLDEGEWDIVDVGRLKKEAEWVQRYKLASFKNIISDAASNQHEQERVFSEKLIKMTYERAYLNKEAEMFFKGCEDDERVKLKATKAANKAVAKLSK